MSGGCQVPLCVSSLPDMSHAMNAPHVMIGTDQTAVRRWKCCDAVVLSGLSSFYDEKLGMFVIQQVIGLGAPTSLYGM